MSEKKKIVIAGAGFAGVAVCLTLAKKINRTTHEIILIDELTTHNYTPDFYEIATAFNPQITQECLTKLKDTVAIPLKTIFKNRRVTLIQDSVQRISPEKNTIMLEKNGAMLYDYLAVTLGSRVNYYDIPGLRENCLPLKTVHDALTLNCHIDAYLYHRWRKKDLRDIYILIVGGGATGVELACELAGYRSALSRKYNYPPWKIHLLVIEAGKTLGGGGDNAWYVTEKILYRFKSLDIAPMMKTALKQAEKDAVIVRLENGGERRISKDILIWTGGVTTPQVIIESFRLNKNEALPVNAFLQHERYPNIFSCGDCAAIMYSTHRRAPLLAQLARKQGIVMGRNIALSISKKMLKKYAVHVSGIILPLGGSFALFVSRGLVYGGRSAWMIRRLIDLMYSMSILPKWYAFKKWIRDTKLFLKND